MGKRMGMPCLPAGRKTRTVPDFERMKYDQDKVDEMTLALLYLVTTAHQEGLGARAWGGFDSSTMERLRKKGWIDAKKSKAMSLHVTEKGFKKSEQLFLKHFGQKEK